MLPINHALCRPVNVPNDDAEDADGRQLIAFLQHHLRFMSTKHREYALVSQCVNSKHFKTLQYVKCIVSLNDIPEVYGND